MNIATPGLLVNYYPAPNDPGAHPKPGMPMAALVADVAEDGTLSLAVWDAKGSSFTKTGVVLGNESLPGQANLRQSAFVGSKDPAPYSKAHNVKLAGEWEEIPAKPKEDRAFANEHQSPVPEAEVKEKHKSKPKA